MAIVLAVSDRVNAFRGMIYSEIVLDVREVPL